MVNLDKYMKPKKLILLVLATCCFISGSIIFYNVSKKKDKMEEQNDVKVVQVINGEEVEEKIGTKVTETIDSDNIEELVESAKKQLIVDTNKRDIDEDATRIYISNFIIKNLYENEKTYNKYKEICNSDDASVIMAKISEEVANYMNEEYGND